MRTGELSGEESEETLTKRVVKGGGDGAEEEWWESSLVIAWREDEISQYMFIYIDIYVYI